jgi:very-short-patch-repair endonuclease
VVPLATPPDQWLPLPTASSYRPLCRDFVCPQARLVIELDGSQHFERNDDDERRTDFLRWKGFRVLRFWNVDVLKHPDEVLTAIDAALSDPNMNGRLD